MLAARLATEGAVAPAIWPLEMLNIFTSAVRRQRIDSKTAAAFGKKAMRLEVDILLVLIETHKNVHGNRPSVCQVFYLHHFDQPKRLGHWPSKIFKIIKKGIRGMFQKKYFFTETYLERSSWHFRLAG